MTLNLYRDKNCMIIKLWELKVNLCQNCNGLKIL